VLTIVQLVHAAGNLGRHRADSGPQGRPVRQRRKWCKTWLARAQFHVVQGGHHHRDPGSEAPPLSDPGEAGHHRRQSRRAEHARQRLACGPTA
jgi:hypothetical protein